MKIYKKICIALLALIIAVIILPYLWVEANTLIYSDEFKDLYLQTYDESYCIDEDNYCRVFYKAGNKAKIFFATDTSTFMCHFSRTSENDDWKICDADVLWTKHGSASNFSFPFYPVKDLKSYFIVYDE